MCGTHGAHIFLWMMLLCVSNYVQPMCVHDSVQSKVVNKANINYRQTWDRRKRAASESYFPIRIHTDFHNIETFFSPDQARTLKSTVRYTTGTIANILSVIPVLGNLTLKRSDDACAFSWRDGKNKDRCGDLDTTYRGETCMDQFKIPDEHLEGLPVWNHSHPEPSAYPIKAGPGIPDTDYILYVTATSSSQCHQKYGTLIAHAAFCQVDQNSRPIAGHINFCPVWLEGHIEEADRLQLATLHELFHALGFSSKLFEEFRDCSKSTTGLDCPKRYKPIRTVYGVKRLVTPSLVNLASNHFNCVTNQLDNEFSPMLQEKNGEITSHWDEAFLYGSFMSPSIGLPSATLVDPFTLAAMQDSGWYQVKTKQADFYVWGKGEGCRFALHEQCSRGTKYFCTGSGTGCHFLHRHKADCDTNTFLRHCRLYVAQEKGYCDSNYSKNKVYQDKFNPHIDKRCFVSNITETSTPGFLDGRCYDVQCIEGEIHVRISQETPWLKCPSNSAVRVPGYDGVIQCPEADVICNQIKLIVSDTFTTSTKSTAATIASTPPLPTLQETDIPDILRIQIVFANAHYSRLAENGQVETFITELTFAVMKRTRVDRSRMNDITLRSGSVIYQFLLLPIVRTESTQAGPRSEQVFQILKSTIESRKFNISLPDGSTFIATNVSWTIAGPRVLPRSMSTGTIVGIVIGCILIVITVSLALFVIQCLCCVQQNRRRNPRNPAQLPPAWRPSQDQLVMNPTASTSFTVGESNQEFRA